MRSGLAATAALMVALVAAPAATANVETKIVGGAPASVQQVPWQVALAFSQAAAPGDSGYERQFCGGTLVAPTIVITAAHCVYELAPDPQTCGGAGEGFNFPASEFAVFTGRTTLSSSEGQEINVAEIYYFEGTPEAPVLEDQSTDGEDGDELYDCATNQWDAVFLSLTQPSTTGTPIKIAGAGEEALWAPGAPALISGWGSISGGAPSFPDQLHAAAVAMVADSTCGAATVYGADFFPATMVCAGIFPAGGVDTCQGDSGGPLVVGAFQRSLHKATRAVNAVRLVGDTSFGEGCGLPNRPGVYGRLAADPMRSAFRNGILTVAGVDVVGAGAVAPDATPPVTEIGKHPAKRGRKRKAKFTFTANEEATFECALDKHALAPCSSPFVKKRVAAKSHKFRVRATDAQGNVGPESRFAWRVKRR